MQVTVEAPSELERRVKITLPANAIDEKYSEKVAEFAKSAAPKGFRPGKMPRSLIESRYGASIKQEVLEDLIRSSFQNALQEQKLALVGTPTISPQPYQPGKPFEYEAAFEVMPEIKDVHFADVQLEKLNITVQDVDVEKVITTMRQMHTQWKIITHRPAEMADRLGIHIELAVDGNAYPQGTGDYHIVLGKNMVFNEVEAALVGTHAGDIKEVALTLPGEVKPQEIAGKPANITVTVNEVAEPELPPIDDSFMRMVGVKSGVFEDLQQEIRGRLEQYASEASKRELKQAVLQALLTQNTVEVPRALIDDEVHRMVHQNDKENQHNHDHDHELHDHHLPEETKQQYEAAAHKRVSLGLLMTRFAEDKSLSIDQTKIEALLLRLASDYEDPTEFMKWYGKDKNRMSDIQMQVFEDQVVEKLLEGVVVTEKEVAYHEFMQKQQPAGHELDHDDQKV